MLDKEAAPTTSSGCAVELPRTFRQRQHLQPLHFPGPSNGSCGSGPAVQNWRKAVCIIFTVLLYCTVSYLYRAPDRATVVYTCSDGEGNVGPRAVNTRFDTIIETADSAHSESTDDYFCKVRVAREMVQKHPGKRIVYVDSDAAVDLQGVIEDVGCSRMSFFVHGWQSGFEHVESSFFCFPADAGSMEILDLWWDIRAEYPRYPGGRRDQGAINDLINGNITTSNASNDTVKVLMFDPTGLHFAHCSHAVGDQRAACKRNLNMFICWDRAVVLCVGFVQRCLWLAPLALAFGRPLIAPGAIGRWLDVNPLTILTALGLPHVLSKFLVRNNRVSGELSTSFNKMFSGVFVLNIGGVRRWWVPMIGLLQWPRNPSTAVFVVFYIMLLCFMILLRNRLDRWTCMTCPTLYHWLVWSKAASDRCSSLAGSGRWLSIVPSGPDLYHLSCGSNTRGEAGVPVHRIYGKSDNGTKDAQQCSHAGVSALGEEGYVGKVRLNASSACVAVSILRRVQYYDF